MPLWEDRPIKELLSLVKRLSPECYLVGGAIRDSLLSRPVKKDLDLVPDGDGIRIAREFARLIGPSASFVPLDDNRGTARVVIDRGDTATFDFTSLRRSKLRDDLRARDFTINALALHLDDLVGAWRDKLVDPTGGRKDIETGTLRVCSDSAFREDPLRVLRAFRFSAELGFEISAETLSMISETKSGLSETAPERIRDEVIAMLSAEHCSDSLACMDGLGLLDDLFPELAATRGVEQNVYHHLDVRGHTLETLRLLEALLERRAARFGDLSVAVDAYVGEEPVRGRPRRALLKLAALFHDSGKPDAMSVDESERIRFFGHEKVSRELFESAGPRLKLAVREIRMVAEWVGSHMRPMIFTQGPVSKRTLYRLHRSLEGEAVGLLLLFLADLGASRGPARPEGLQEGTFRQVSDALELFFGLDNGPQPPLLNGHDLMGLFGLRPGPLLGRVLRWTAELQAAGEIATREDAVAAAGHFLENEENRSVEDES